VRISVESVNLSRQPRQRLLRRVRRLGWLIVAGLFPSASLLGTTSGCAGSDCTFQCHLTNVCLDAGCFHDNQSQCADYPNSSEWTTTWEKGAAIHCARQRDANGNTLSVSCIGTEGEATDVACICKFTTVNGVVQCG
jgi:hypothetical protein